MRGADAYIMRHGNSFDFNHQGRIDDLIVFGISLLLVAFFLFTQPRLPSKSPYRAVGIVLAALGLEVLLYLVTIGIGLSRCLQF